MRTRWFFFSLIFVLLAACGRGQVEATPALRGNTGSLVIPPPPNEADSLPSPIVAVVPSKPAQSQSTLTLPTPTEVLPTATTPAVEATTAAPVVAPATTVPTAVPPTATPVPATTETLAILSFTADAVDLDEGKQITFVWESTGGEEAFIYNFAQGSMRFPTGWEVPPSGSITVDVTSTQQPDPHFQVFVYDGPRLGVYENVADAVVDVPWTCANSGVFSTIANSCTGEAATASAAAEQHFENGRMIWLATNEQPTAMIYVLYNEPVNEGGTTIQWQRFADTWTSAELESDPTISPPVGFFEPERGFGKVWREEAGVRERLGWATTPEVGFDSVWRLQASESLITYRHILQADGLGLTLTGEPAGNYGWMWENFAP